MKRLMLLTKLIPFALFFLISACTQTQRIFLIKPNMQVLEKPHFVDSGVDEFNFNSCKSAKKNSIVEIGGWHIKFNEKRQAFRFDIRIINNCNDTLITPDDIIIIDADKKSLRLLRPDEYVYYTEGMTSQEALSKASAMSVYASQLQATQGYTGTIYTYGTIYSSYYSGHSTYRAYPTQSPASSFTTGFARGYALGLAIRAARISRNVREYQLTALKPTSTLPQCSNIGRVWSLAGKQPIELHIFTCGDHHIIKLDHVP